MGTYRPFGGKRTALCVPCTTDESLDGLVVRHGYIGTVYRTRCRRTIRGQAEMSQSIPRTGSFKASCCPPWLCPKYVAIVLVALIAPAVSWCQDPAPVRELLERQSRAWNAGDLETFLADYWHSEELTFSAGGKTTRGWQGFADRFRQKYTDRAVMGTLSFADLEIRFLHPDACFVLGRWQLTRDAGNQQGNFTIILQRMESGWTIVHDHTSVLEESP